MKKLLCILLALLMTTAMLTSIPFAVSAATEGGAIGDEEEYCTVWIYLDPTDAEPVTGVDVMRGEVYGTPAEPGRDNEVFMGWYTDRDCRCLYDPAQPIMTDTSLFPHWETPDSDGDVYCSVWIYLDPTFTDPIAGVDVLQGDFYGTPADPGRDNEVFMGWYTDRCCAHMYDPSQPITKDTALYPRWEIPDDNGDVYCSVWIYLDPAHTDPIAGVDVLQGEIYGTVADPGRENEVFMGLYTDRSCVHMYDPTLPITKDTSLYPRWEIPDDNGDVYCSVWIYLDPTYTEPVTGVDVLQGDIYGTPAEPGREDEAFMGWYTDRSLINQYDPAMPLTKDISLYAGWGEISAGDVNADGTVDIIDATTVQKHIAGAITLSGGRLSAADADGSGTVDINDVTAIQRYIAKLTDSIG